MGSNLSKRELLRQKRKDQARRKLITVTLIVLGTGALFTTAIMLPKLLSTRTRYSLAEGFTIGDPNAPVSVVQFSSYSCGFCRSFSDNEEPDFIANYVDPGLVFYRYVNIPSNNADSQLAAKASYCAADQDHFFDYKGYLYNNSGAPDGFSPSSLLDYADSAGLDTSDFQACLEGQTFATAFMDDIQYAQDIGITYTPSFLVNDQLVGAGELLATVDALLGQ